MVKFIFLAVAMIIRSAGSAGAVPGKNDDSTSTGTESAASVICPLSKVFKPSQSGALKVTFSVDKDRWLAGRKSMVLGNVRACLAKPGIPAVLDFRPGWNFASTARAC
ncbi:MAG: hypothetical protein OXH79_05905 [Boseongicola sp.]|nr:hypothetical protein [Boseongicola sp.]